MEDKEIINEEEKAEEVIEEKPVEEAVQEEGSEAEVEEKKEEESLDSAIAIEKPSEGEEPYDVVVEKERNQIIAQSKKGNLLSTISIIIVLAFSIAGIFTLTSIPALAYSLMGAAVVTLIVFSILTRRVARPDVKTYIVNASAAINKYTFADNRFSDVFYDPSDKLELGDVASDGVYVGLVRTASRNICEGKYEDRSFKVCECALFNPNQGRKQDPAFIGKYLRTTNDLHFEGKILIISKGEKDVDLPNDLEGLQQVVNEEKFFVYANDEKAIKALDKDFIKRIKSISVSNHLLNLTVVIWSGRSIVYASYDDATITLPFYEKYQADTAVQYRDNLIEFLDALKLLRE